MKGFAVLTLFLIGKADGQNCPDGLSNYSRTDYKEVTEEVSDKTIIWTVIHDDCNVFKEIASGILSLFTKENKCDTKEIQREKIVKRNSTTIEKYQVVTCCLGYFNRSNVCEPGCPKGEYGTNCTDNCSCPSFCHKDSGECICDAGFSGKNCSEECSVNTYGIDCQYKCMCKNNSTCNSTDGTCNCTSPGWQGTLCNTKCTNNTFGLFCNESCACNGNQTCDPVDGSCTCKSGWKGQNCSAECGDMTYGIECMNNCTCNGTHTQYCNKSSGFCHCRPGYMGMYCNDDCRFGLYGHDCEKNCSAKCTNTPYCDPENGTCICLGTQGPNCTQECDVDKYGPNCEWSCSCNNSVNASCHNVDGHCYCEPGWAGQTCDRECEPGLFGQNCSRNCSEMCTGTDYCDPVNGTCICIHSKGINCSEECDDGYYGYNCRNECSCPKTNNNGSCDPKGICLCDDGWTGVSCETKVPGNDSFTQKETRNTGSFVEENLVYIILLAVGLLLVIIVIATAIKWRRVSTSKRVNKEQDSRSSTAVQNPSYNSVPGDAENIPLKKDTNHSNMQMYEDAVLENENQSELTSNHVTHSADNADENHKTENYDHAYSESNMVTHCIEDEYSIPDKDNNIKKLENSGENDKERDQQQHGELYDSTDDKVVENISNEYNTFQDVLNVNKEAAKKEAETEEDYDVITPARSQKKKFHDHEHYSSFEQVRKLSSRGAVEEEDTYNVLNEDLPKHRSAKMTDNSYHHISLKDKTVDGDVFASAASHIDSNNPRKTRTDKNLYKQTSLRDVSIDEESENDGAQTNETSEMRKKDDEFQEGDTTEVIYDECDLDDFTDEPNLEKCVTETESAVQLDSNIAEIVYEECDASDKEESRPPSGAIYENVEEDDEAQVEKEEENQLDNQPETKERENIKRAAERRREDYEDFSI